MFINEDLKQYLETSSVVRSQSLITAEWNMNIANNISKIGNYRYRPTDNSSIYRLLPNTFDVNDSGNYYTNATNADIQIDGGFQDNNQPLLFTLSKDKEKLLYSLEDCFRQFRPRSGINKASFIPGKHLHHTNISMSNRPRYYMADKEDKFKYWSSYRVEQNIDRGIANKLVNGQYYIEDAVPFVVYNNKIPTNRIVIKMQTNVGTVDLGPFSNNSGSFADPLYGDSNKTTPVRWKIQYLDNNNWTDAITFNNGSTRRDGTPIIKSDGYVELEYGLVIPEKYRSVFVHAETYHTASFLPEESINGYAYLVKENSNDIGTYYVWYQGAYETFIPSYGWVLFEETVDRLTNFVTDLTSPATFTNPLDGKTQYREFQYISGIRIVAETMNKVNSTLDIIEISPRLAVNLTDRTLDFSITKNAADLGASGLPVGQLLASTGTLKLFDYDDAFNPNNSNSIIYGHASKNIQMRFYEVIIDVDGFDYFVPIKTLYSEGFPSINAQTKEIDLQLRDLYFYLESLTAPQTLSVNASLSYAVSQLLDSIGFSNYVFKRLTNEDELIIPFFFIGPDQSVAQVLNDLAVSTQTAMFFDEYNNFVMMSKNYMLANKDERNVDLTLYGTQDMESDMGIRNKTIKPKIANIIEVASQDNNVFNDGVINYKTRSIQRTYGSINQAYMVDQDKTWIYKPALLWEVTGSEPTKSQNEENSGRSDYALTAMPLNSDLSSAVPSVVNNQIINNTVDVGESIYYVARYNGYFYSNGEIIKYDAVQYNVSGIGNVWIKSLSEYQNYFSKLPFNGKMYPTGLIRIYSEPNYQTVNGVLQLKSGEVAKHGRGQFGTPVVAHYAGLNPYWYDNNNIRGCSMRSELLFTDAELPETAVGPAGLSNARALQTTRNSIVKNFFTSAFLNESNINRLRTTQSGTVQSSALVMNGPSFTTLENPLDFISYVYKPLNNKFRHFGTRMRIIGKIENSETRGQTPLGSTPYYVVAGSQPNQSINISGSSGGLAVLLNPETNNGYYFEVVALTENDINAYTNSPTPLHNIIFYKIMQNTEDSTKAVPVKLWGGLSGITVDNGSFATQNRRPGDSVVTVYDLAVEYVDIGKTRRFYLYINNKLITTVDDINPLPIYSNMALFTRGSARCAFENIYAITNNYSQNTAYALDTPVNSIYDADEIDVNESFRKYALSGVVQATYLSGISPAEPPKHNIYFEEFGSIMRECAYFNIKYDKAYPAIYAKLSPTFNRTKGYTVSGFRAGSYGAEFMIFNSTDAPLSLDSSSGNYLTIQGVTFTQESENRITVDEYFSKNSDFSNPQFSGTSLVSSPFKFAQDYQDIKVSRLTYGRKEFSLTTPYVQTQDDANELMEWIINKIMKPRKSIGLDIFSMPIVQLGDIVSIDYVKDGVDIVAPATSRFVVYNIQYKRSDDGPQMTIYLSEVV